MVERNYFQKTITTSLFLMALCLPAVKLFIKAYFFFFCVKLIKATTQVPCLSPLPSVAAWDCDSVDPGWCCWEDGQCRREQLLPWGCRDE